MLAMNIASRSFYCFLTCWFVFYTHLCVGSLTSVPSNVPSVFSNQSSVPSNHASPLKASSHPPTTMFIRNTSQGIVQGSGTDSISDARGMETSSPDNASLLHEKVVNYDEVPLNGDVDTRPIDAVKKTNGISEVIDELDLVDRDDEQVSKAVDYPDVFQCTSCNLINNVNEHDDTVSHERVDRELVEDRDDDIVSENHLSESDEQMLEQNNKQFRSGSNGNQIDAVSSYSDDIVEGTSTEPENTNSRGSGVQINRRYRREKDIPSHISDVSNENEDGRYIKRDNIEFSKKINYKVREKVQGTDPVSRVSNLNNVDMRVNEINPYRDDVKIVSKAKPDVDNQRKKNKIKKQKDNKKPVQLSPEDETSVASQVDGKIKQTSQNSTRVVKSDIAVDRPSDMMPSEYTSRSDPVLSKQNKETMLNDESTNTDGTHSTNDKVKNSNSNKQNSDSSQKYYSTKPKKSIGDASGKQLGNPHTLNVFASEDDPKNTSAINATPAEPNALIDTSAVANTPAGASVSTTSESTVPAPKPRPVVKKNLTVGYLTATKGTIKNKQGLLVSGAMTLALHDVSTALVFLK